MIEVREATAADRDAILALRGRCFPDDDPEKRDPRFWDWEFGHGRMFVAADGPRLVAHLGFMPQSYGLLAVDAMTDPQYRRQQLFSRVAAFAGEQVGTSYAWQIRDAVLPAMVHAGWTPVTAARVLIRPMVLPAFGGRAGRSGDAAAMSAISGRSAEFLHWRYFANPLWTYDVTMNDGAYLVTRRTTLKGYKTLAIIEAAGDPREAKRLLGAALRTARTTFAATLVTRDHPKYWWFLRNGFLPGPHRFRFLARDSTRTDWPLCWADTDHL
jgi:hypothetical protein